jgi:hypothetical protein
VTGVDYANVEISTSQLFRHLYPNRQLPKFVWLQVNGVAGKDDFGLFHDAERVRPRDRYVLSDRAIEILRKFGLDHAEMEVFSRQISTS